MIEASRMDYASRSAGAISLFMTESLRAIHVDAVIRYNIYLARVYSHLLQFLAPRLQMQSYQLRNQHQYQLPVRTLQTQLVLRVTVDESKLGQ